VLHMVLYGILVQFHVNRDSWAFLGSVIGLFWYTLVVVDVVILCCSQCICWKDPKSS